MWLSFLRYFSPGFFTFLLTGVGPFIDQKETREYMMTWEIKPGPTNGMKQSEIVLSFVDFPGHCIGEYSNELAAYLREKGEQPVKVVFEVTSDYGKVRGFHETEIAGLHQWESEWGYAGSSWFSEESRHGSEPNTSRQGGGLNALPRVSHL